MTALGGSGDEYAGQLPLDSATASLRERVRKLIPLRRPSLVWWHELLIILVGYVIYTVIRNGVPSREALADLRATQVINLERSLHLFHELGLNALVFNHASVANVFNYYYATMHFAVTIAVGIWLFARHQAHARALRTVWYLTNLVALIGYEFFPLAPPRLTPGYSFHDTVVIFHTWGSWGEGSIANASNQYAAMPSMHIGWSLWCAVVIVVLAERPWVKVLGALYPLMTLAVIVGTANHYFVDAAGGAVALAAGFALARLLNGRWAFTPDPRVRTADTPLTPEVAVA